MTEGNESRTIRLASARGLATALVFGLLALAVVLAGLTIPIAGTGIVTDPREIFTTLGSALSGPIGGALVGFLAAIREPDHLIRASLLAHLTGCVWMGWSYRVLVYERMSMPRMLVGWMGIVLAYYFLFLVPGFVIGVRAFHPEAYADTYGATTPLVHAYSVLAQGAAPEAAFTTGLTVLVVLALPRKHRRPLW